MSEPRDPTVTESAGVPEPAQSSAAQATDLRTFMIVDIRGYTTYTEEHGDEAGAALVRRFTELVSEVVSSRDGLLLELRGDEALVVFVSARKALRAAVDLQERFAAENLPRGIGIGLDAGEAIPVGDGYRGTALNLAARLCSKAVAGETLASEAVIHLAAKVDGIAYVDARDLRLKGYSDSVRAVVVISSDRAKGRRLVTDRRPASRIRPAFVGLVAIVVVALVAGTSGYVLLNRGGQPTALPTAIASAAALALPTPAATAATAATASPSGPQDPLGGAALPLMAFYEQAGTTLEATTPITLPRNISFFAGGSFWILANNQFNRVDPATHQVIQSINVPLDEPNGYAYDDNYIWITDLSGPRVWRVDQRSGYSTNFPFNANAQDNTAATDVAVGGGSVWLARPDAGTGEIVRMDPQSGKVQAYLPINAWGMSYGADAVWYWQNGSIGRIDPVTEHQSFPPVQLTTEAGLGNIYFAGGDAWTSSADTGSVYRIDPSGRLVATYPLEAGVGEMAPTADTMWVTNANTGTLVGIDLATGQQDRTIDTGHATLAAVAGADQIMVAVGPTVDEAIAKLPGSVLTIAASDFPWWDPAPDPPLNSNWQVRQALYITCANLLTYPDKPGPDGLALVPEVAAAMPTVSADGLTYTFTIRPGFQFSPPSNEAVTAQTFQYTIQRAVSPVFSDSDPGPLMFGDIAGVKAYRAGTADHVTGLVAIGDQLSITLEAPAPDILARLATSYACPVPINGTPALASGLKPDVPVAGAGPYYLADTIRKRLVVFKKNPNYHGQRPQPFDEIAVRLQVAPTTALGLVHSGQVDAVMLNGGDSLSGPESELAADWGPGSAKASAGDQHWFGAPRTNIDTLVLNPSRPAFKDPDVRHAVALALDRAALSTIWVNQPTDQLLIPSVQGTDPAAVATQPDLEAARALMKGRSLSVTMLGFPTEWGCGACQDFEVAVTAELQAIGIDVTVRHPTGSDYPGAGVFDPGSAIDMLDWGVHADYSDPVTMLSGLGNVPWIGTSNIDELTRLETTSGQERVDGMVALTHSLVDDQFLVLPTGYQVYPFFTSERIGCAFVQPAIGAVDLLSLCANPSPNEPGGASASP